jgi:Na+-transporting NADH:ubiquinone oxidoreductase subunit NqrD
LRATKSLAVHLVEYISNLLINLFVVALPDGLEFDQHLVQEFLKVLGVLVLIDTFLQRFLLDVCGLGLLLADCDLLQNLLLI